MIIKTRYIICILLWSFILWVWGLLKYNEYLDFVDLYNQWEYTQILENKSFESAEMLHNYGLTTLNRFISEWMTQIDDLVESNLLFSGSLQKGENEKTRYQYEFTKSLLDMLENSQQQESEDQSSQDQNWQDSESGEENEQEKWEQGERSQSSHTQNGRDSQYFLSEWEEIQPLSPREQQQLDSSIQELKNDQMRNQQFYGKQEQKKNW